jgi:hypothetical protein
LRERLESEHRSGPEAPESEIFNARRWGPLPGDAHQVRRENYWVARQSLEERTRKNMAEAAEEERQRAERAHAFNQAWELHHERYVIRLEAEQDYHTSISQVFRNLDAGNPEDRKIILETAKNVYHSDKAIYYTLQAAFNKTREVYSQEYHRKSVFKRVLSGGLSPTERAMKAALRETKDTRNAYVMGEVLLRHNKVQEKYSAKSQSAEGLIIWDLLKDKIVKNQLTDTAYRYDQKTKNFVPKNEEAAYQARTYKYQPVGRPQEQWAREARYWRREHVSVNREANTEYALARGRRMNGSGEPLAEHEEFLPSYSPTPSQRPRGTSSEYWREGVSDAGAPAAGPAQDHRAIGVAGPRRVAR